MNTSDKEPLRLKYFAQKLQGELRFEDPELASEFDDQVSFTIDGQSFEVWDVSDHRHEDNFKTFKMWVPYKFLHKNDPPREMCCENEHVKTVTPLSNADYIFKPAFR